MAKYKVYAMNRILDPKNKISKYFGASLAGTPMPKSTINIFHIRRTTNTISKNIHCFKPKDNFPSSYFLKQMNKLMGPANNEKIPPNAIIKSNKSLISA